MRRLMRAAGLVLVLGAGASTLAMGQERAVEPEVEYGSAAELAGVRRVFIHAGDDLDARNAIVAHLRKELPSLEIADRADEADVVLAFGGSKREVSAGTNTMTDQNDTQECKPDPKNKDRLKCRSRSTTVETTTEMTQTIEEGRGTVYRRTAAGGRRLLLDYKDTKRSFLERKPATNFARHFVKHYRQANAQG